MMTSGSRFILLVTILALAGIQARNFPDDIQTINGEISFTDISGASIPAVKNNIKLSASSYFERRSVIFVQEYLSKWFIAISNCIPHIQYDKYSRSANFGRPSSAPPSPKPPSGPRPASYVELLVSRKSPQSSMSKLVFLHKSGS